MAKDKSSFLLYRDIIHTVRKLPDKDAGELFKHILSYVNDENPTTDNILVDLAFEPIKQSLKRDLVKYETIRAKNKENAEKRWQQKNATASDRIPSDAKNADIDIDSVSDSDSDNVLSKDNIIRESESKFNFKKELISLGVSAQVASDWLKVRSKKKAANTETAFKSIKSEIKKSPIPANDCIRIAVEKNWQGFKSEWINNLQNQSNGAKENFRTDTKTYTVAANVHVIDASSD